jgi:hypothetical protein
MCKQTAVQWLRDRLKEQVPEQMDIICFWIYMAEKKEKKQIKEAYYMGDYDNSVAGYVVGKDECEDYYNETYGGSNE